MNHLPLVSIITPSYNQAAFLEQTLRSVLEQDYPNIEYLVVDGGSQDGSVEIIQRYADRLAWWVSERDHGQAEAINKGFARARGEIVGWLNSDDLYLPGTIRAAVEAFALNPQAGMVYGDVDSIDASGALINIMRFQPWQLADLMQFNIISQPGVFMRRSVLEQGGYLDLSYHFLLDHHLWLRLARLAPMHYVPQRWAAARFHADAKNVAQAASFGQEAYRITAWLESQPEYSPLFKQYRRKIQAGAHRMNARYLLDGGQARAALAAYMKSLAAHPPTALAETRRILYAAASLLFNVEALKKWYLARRKSRLDS